jgi:5-methylcytosine-specific restriction endonuclease McrA
VTRKWCAVPGCRRFAALPGRYCDDHRPEESEKHRLADQYRDSPGRRGYDAEWQRVRDEYLRQQPACERCRKPAEMVHHRLPIRAGGARLEAANLESLCQKCHQRTHARLGKGRCR